MRVYEEDGKVVVEVHLVPDSILKVGSVPTREIYFMKGVNLAKCPYLASKCNMKS